MAHTEKAKGNPELRDRLPKGAIQKLAEKYNCSWTWIQKVVTGKFEGEAGIISDAEKLAEIEDKRKAEFNQVI